MKLFYSLDMSKDVIFDRLLCQQSGLDYRDVWHKHDDPGVNSRLCEAEKALTASVLPRLRILEREQLGRRKQQILTALNKQATELTQQSRTQQVLYILDYFQLIDVADPSTASLETDFSRIELLQTAQQMTRTQQCPGGDCFLVLTEVRKGESGRSRLALDDLMGSARISSSADCVLLLEPDGGQPTSWQGPRRGWLVQMRKSGGRLSLLGLRCRHPQKQVFPCWRRPSPIASADGP